MSADRYPTRTTPAQAELLTWMEERGAVPTLLLHMPGSTVDLGPLDGAWRDAHGGQPVDPRTLRGLEDRGIVVVTDAGRGLGAVRTWTLAHDSHRDGSPADTTPAAFGGALTR